MNFRIILYLYLLFASISCSSVKNKSLEDVLSFAGNNRIELEKVLEHYKNDSLKLKAATYLIENMPLYYSYVGSELDSLHMALDQYADYGCYVMRSVGIPAAIDTYLWSPVTHIAHTWNVVLDTTGCTVPFNWGASSIKMNQGENAIDNDPLTFFTSSMNPGWVGLDLKTPQPIKHITYIPRNDNNFICPGDKYELYYFSADGWKSLGIQVAEKPSLVYENAPRHALFWLHDLTQGIEEQTFTYCDDKQIFTEGYLNLLFSIGVFNI